MFLHKNLFFQYLLLFQSQSCLLESTAAIFRQSAGYVDNCHTVPQPTVIFWIDGMLYDRDLNQ